MCSQIGAVLPFLPKQTEKQIEHAFDLFSCASDRNVVMEQLFFLISYETGEEIRVENLVCKNGS